MIALQMILSDPEPDLKDVLFVNVKYLQHNVTFDHA